MKVLISVIFGSIFLNVLAQIYFKDDPNCKFSKLPPNTLIEDCCESLPHFYNPQLFRRCNKSCNSWIIDRFAYGARKCCILNCSLTAVGAMERNGPIIPEEMIKLIKRNITKNSENWNSTVEEVVMRCFNTLKDHGPETISNMSPQCESHEVTLALNITRCIRREMFFACKDKAMTENKKCQELVEYGKGCVYWPWQCLHRDRHAGGLLKDLRESLRDVTLINPKIENSKETTNS